MLETNGPGVISTHLFDRLMSRRHKPSSHLAGDIGLVAVVYKVQRIFSSFFLAR